MKTPFLEKFMKPFATLAPFWFWSLHSLNFFKIIRSLESIMQPCNNTSCKCGFCMYLHMYLYVFANVVAKLRHRKVSNAKEIWETELRGNKYSLASLSFKAEQLCAPEGAGVNHSKSQSEK